MGAHACNHSIREAGAGRSEALVHPQLQNELKLSMCYKSPHFLLLLSNTETIETGGRKNCIWAHGSRERGRDAREAMVASYRNGRSWSNRLRAHILYYKHGEERASCIKGF